MVLSIAIIGPGLVGSEFIAQLAAHQLTCASNSSLAKLPVIAIANSKKLLLPTAPKSEINLASWASDLQQSSKASDINALIDFAASKAPCAIVDCTSSDAVAALYPSWLKKGLHIVTPNKKGFSGDYSLYQSIKEISQPKANTRFPLVYHESTVGAGLPILSTLSDLVNTGDEIVKIEGIFSGTLSYIFNNFSVAGKQTTEGFSDIVKVAKEKGYTEPDPRDDLNGMDVARKVVILGRVAGLKLDLNSLHVENIVPEALRSIASADEFMAQLPSFDGHFKKLNEDAQKRGEVLRLVGVVDPRGQSSVKLVGYPASHPFASLKGSDNIIAFTTKRFPNPLIVQGAGAGAAVTAFGMFSDVLKIASITGYGHACC
ncbi:hypothetical protein HDV05_005422 [Chytridiales sp. JEL 0842]|nr:hypothetical protein HDV05_005422 [Chytridiales sp. JEL 0842]